MQVLRVSYRRDRLIGSYISHLRVLICRNGHKRSKKWRRGDESDPKASIRLHEQCNAANDPSQLSCPVVLSASHWVDDPPYKGSTPDGADDPWKV